MNKKLIFWSSCIGFLLTIIIVLVYFFYIKEQVFLLYKGNADTWFHDIIYSIYPRFEVEKHRFDVHFFVEKSQQVVIRFSIFMILLLGSFFFFDKIKSFFEQEKNEKNEHYFRILFYSFLLIASYDWWESLVLLEHIRPFYSPIFLLKFIPQMLPLSTNLILYSLMVLASMCTILNIKPRIFSWISIVCFVYIHALFCSFDKMNHVFTTFIYAGILVPFSFFSKTSWNIRLIQVSVCLTYFFAGTEKLLISHFSWINPITFKAYLALHQAPIGMIVAENTLLCTLLPIGALVFQLTFFIILFYPKMSKWYILGGFCFHWGTTLLFGISWFINPWLMPYLFFIDWEKIILRIQDKQP